MGQNRKSSNRNNNWNNVKSNSRLKKIRWVWKMKAKILFWETMSKKIKSFWVVRNLVRTGACKVVEVCHVMKLLAVFSVIALTSKSIANCDAYDSYITLSFKNSLTSRVSEIQPLR